MGRNMEKEIEIEMEMNTGMKLGKKVFWGILFLLAAVAVIAGGMGYLEGFNFWTILVSVCLVGFLVEGIFHRSFGGILFPIAFLVILFDEQLGAEAITPWPVLGAAFLGTIGLTLLFPKSKKYKHNGHKNHFCQDVGGSSLDGEAVHYEVSFGEAVKYVTSKELVDAHLECSFGSLSVYFDNATLKDGEAHVHAECSFGEMVLYVPADWRVVVNVTTSFGGVEERGHSNPEGTNILYIRGQVAFGELEICYL